jgi:hypothetical protein
MLQFVDVAQIDSIASHHLQNLWRSARQHQSCRGSSPPRPPTPFSIGATASEPSPKSVAERSLMPEPQCFIAASATHTLLHRCGSSGFTHGKILIHLHCYSPSIRSDWNSCSWSWQISGLHLWTFWIKISLAFFCSVDLLKLWNSHFLCAAGARLSTWCELTFSVDLLKLWTLLKSSLWMTKKRKVYLQWHFILGFDSLVIIGLTIWLLSHSVCWDTIFLLVEICDNKKMARVVFEFMLFVLFC